MLYQKNLVKRVGLLILNEEQGGRCACCGEFTSFSHGACLDHDHRSGRWSAPFFADGAISWLEYVRRT